MVDDQLILLLDDDAEMRSMVTDYFYSVKNGFRVISFGRGAEALAYLSGGQGPLPAVIITDLKMPGMDGLEFITQAKVLQPYTPMILITAFGSIETAISAIKKGAFDYIVKPFKLAELTVTIDRALEFSRLHQENKVLRQEINRQYRHADLIGKSPAMKEVFDLVARVSGAQANVLITGESGTGKEVVARAIHNGGPRASGPFVAINCSAIPENLLESELFGHARGAFTGAVSKKRGLFEEAQQGTIFLDEIGDMPVSLQAKLLRVIQERKIRAVGDNVQKDIDVRIIAATHKDIKAAIKRGQFREDLYYRLSVIPIVIPPLRHRQEDIPLLVGHFLQKYRGSSAAHVQGFTPMAMTKMLAYPWEGNVRELENVVERSIVLARGPWIDANDLPLAADSPVESFVAGATLDMPTVEQLEKRYILHVLQKTGGRKDKASQILGINRRTLYRKEREYGLIHEDSPEEMGEESDPSFEGESL